MTARAEESDRQGLTLGADDYVVKPFSPRELTARVQAALGASNACRSLRHRWYWRRAACAWTRLIAPPRWMAPTCR